MPRYRSAPPSAALRKKCCRLVYRTAARYGIPPVLITAHIRSPQADRARREVMCIMISKYGMKRAHVAAAFGRDLRRVRKSVLGV